MEEILGFPLTELLTPRVRYLGTDENVLSLEALTEIYHLVAQNLKLARERMNKKSKVLSGPIPTMHTGLNV